MNQPTESSLNSMNGMIINHIKLKVDAVRPGIDWVQVQFNRNFQGQIIGLQADDPELHYWLQRIKIERNDTNEQVQ